jgi:hypothetical protein
VEPAFAPTVLAVRSEAMEYEIEDDSVLFDPSTNPSLAHRRRPVRSRHGTLASWSRRNSGQKAVVIPEEEDQLV